MIFGRFSVLFGRFPSGCHDESCYTSPVILLFSWGPSFWHRLVKKPKKSGKNWLGEAFGPKMMILEGKSPAIVPLDFMVFWRKWRKQVVFLCFLVLLQIGNLVFAGDSLSKTESREIRRKTIKNACFGPKT